MLSFFKKGAISIFERMKNCSVPLENSQSSQRKLSVFVEHSLAWWTGTRELSLLERQLTGFFFFQQLIFFEKSIDCTNRNKCIIHTQTGKAEQQLRFRLFERERAMVLLLSWKTKSEFNFLLECRLEKTSAQHVKRPWEELFFQTKYWILFSYNFGRSLPCSSFFTILLFRELWWFGVWVTHDLS